MENLAHQRKALPNLKGEASKVKICQKQMCSCLQITRHDKVRDGKHRVLGVGRKRRKQCAFSIPVRSPKSKTSKLTTDEPDH